MNAVINNKNYHYWDVLKGIGIICIVMGHSCWFAYKYVYEFHLALFFFISGYLYSEDKYGNNPYLNLTNRVKSLWGKYIIWTIFMVLFHDLFFKVGLINDPTRYDLTLILEKLALKYGVHILMSLFIGLWGYYLMRTGHFLLYQFQVVLFVVPIFSIAYFVRNMVPDLNNILKWYIALPILAIFVLIVNRLNWQIDLAGNIIPKL